MLVDPAHVELGVQPGELTCELGQELVEQASIDQARVAIGDRGDPDQGLEFGDGARVHSRMLAKLQAETSADSMAETISGASGSVFGRKRFT
ncbi:hypothetical protein GCM10025867_34930 [Frondihabitans sucicola]|uniref:Uncharacterized protein n=1 Tax=Frondihabitans sucicola TaxID=1268041 RepID=A0ABM8GS12_9MICO|nr:hypothetical protein GCM10025867_34930 [Frondihabitans sucicola]